MHFLSLCDLLKIKSLSRMPDRQQCARFRHSQKSMISLHPTRHYIMYSTFAYAKKSADASFEKITISRNEPGDDDVQFDIGRYTLLEISRSPYPGMSPGMTMFRSMLVRYSWCEINSIQAWSLRWLEVPNQVTGRFRKVTEFSDLSGHYICHHWQWNTLSLNL